MHNIRWYFAASLLTLCDGASQALPTEDPKPRWPGTYSHYYWMDASYGTAEVQGRAQSGMAPSVPKNIYGLVTGGNLNIPGIAEKTLDVVKQHKKALNHTAQVPSSIPELKFLYIGSASGDDEWTMHSQLQPFTDKGFKIEIGKNVFWPKMQNYSNYTSIVRHFEKVDIVVFSYGDTLFGLDAMSRKGKTKSHKPWSLMKHIRHLHNSNKLPVIYGGSAGLIAWFDAGHSDSCSRETPTYPLVRVPALGLLPGFVCPHFDVQADASTTAQKKIGKDLLGHTYRGYDFALHLVKDTGNELGLGLDNDVAIVLTGDSYSVFPRPPWRPSWWPSQPPNAYQINKATASGIFNNDGSISRISLSRWWYSVRRNNRIAKQGKLSEIVQPGRFWADPDLTSQCHTPQNLPTDDHRMSQHVGHEDSTFLQKLASIFI